VKEPKKYTGRRKSARFPLLLMVCMAGCVSPFEPEIQKYEDLLVVDGAISNIPGSVYVKLSKTSSYHDRTEYPVKSAGVTLIDDLDNRISFINPSPGEFLPPDPNFAGQVGRSYKIMIETADGIICESVLEELKEPVALDEVKYAFSKHEEDGEWDLEIQLDVMNGNNLTTYFYWEYAETWEFEVPYTSPNEPDSRVCYKMVKPPVFLIYSTENMAQKQLVNYPLYSIDTKSNRLYIKYSVIVTQHTISERTYQYYRDLKEVNENRGTLFDTAPVTLIGNINNLSNPGQPVLGNFQVSGSVAKMIFIRNEDIADKLYVTSGYDNCQLVYAGIITDAYLLDSLTKAGWFVMDSVYNPAVEDMILSLTNSKGCYDCKMDGTNMKPDYWDNE
jgi:hypothetical protein